MSYGRLIYYNKNSTCFGAGVVYPLVQAVTRKDTTPTPAVGVNSSYINDNLNYTNITQQLAFFVERPTFCKDWFTWGMDFGGWLTSKDRFAEYEPFYFEPFRRWHWEAYLSENPVVAPQEDNIANIAVSLVCKPFLVDDEAIRYQSVPTMPTYNPAKYSSLPLFHVVGNGDFTLTVNGAQYQFRDTDDELFMDSEKWTIYRSLTECRANRAVLPNHEYPMLVPDKNTISLQSNYSRFGYRPGWRRAVV